MGVSLVFSGASDQQGETDGPFFLCSSSAWTAFIGWVRQLPASYFPAMLSLVESGSVSDTAQLNDELRTAVLVILPPPSVAATLHDLAARLGDGAEDETLTIVGDEAEPDVQAHAELPIPGIRRQTAWSSAPATTHESFGGPGSGPHAAATRERVRLYLKQSVADSRHTPQTVANALTLEPEEVREALTSLVRMGQINKVGADLFGRHATGKEEHTALLGEVDTRPASPEFHNSDRQAAEQAVLRVLRGRKGGEPMVRFQPHQELSVIWQGDNVRAFVAAGENGYTVEPNVVGVRTAATITDTTPAAKADAAVRKALGIKLIAAHAELPVPRVRQQTAWSCGPASLAAVARAFGRNVNEADVTRLTGANPEQGTPPEALLDGCRRLGLQAEAVERMTLEQLAEAIQAGHPVLVCMVAASQPGTAVTEDSGHWAVVSGMDRDTVTLTDPAAGQIVMPQAEFLARWQDEAAGTERIYTRFGIVVGGPAAFAEVDEFCGGKGSKRPGPCGKKDHVTARAHANAAEHRLKQAQAKHDRHGTEETAMALRHAGAEHANLESQAQAAEDAHAAETEHKADALTISRSEALKQRWQDWKAARKKSQESLPTPVDNATAVGDNTPVETKTPTQEKTVTAPRKLSVITEDFANLRARLNNQKPGTPEHAASLEKLAAVKAEMAAALPALSDPQATQIREQHIRGTMGSIADADRKAVDAGIQAERSPHMAPVAAQAKALAAQLRTGLDRMAGHADSGWWMANAHSASSHLARGLAGQNGFIKSMPKEAETLEMTPKEAARARMRKEQAQGQLEHKADEFLGAGMEAVRLEALPAGEHISVKPGNTFVIAPEGIWLVSDTRDGKLGRMNPPNERMAAGLRELAADRVSNPPPAPPKKPSEPWVPVEAMPGMGPHD